MKEINLRGKKTYFRHVRNGSFCLNKNRIAILGYGVENQALLAWLVKHGVKDITICDKNPNIKILNSKQIQNPKSKIQNKNYPLSIIHYQLGKGYLKNLVKFDVVFRTPGIPYLLPEIQKVRKAGVEISSQIKLFFDLCPAKIIGVTGTKGKGTTASLISAILANSLSHIANGKTSISYKQLAISQKPQVFLGGNIGNAPIEFLDKLSKDDWVVLELSSFQLQDMNKSSQIAVVLDIKSDHLDYHKTQKEYIDAKTNIVRYQKKDDFAVINLDYLTSFKFAEISPTENDYYFSRRKSVDLGTFVEWTPRGRGAHFGKIILRTSKKDYEICRTYDIALRGEHNLENICAAITAAYLAGAKIEAIKKAVPRFPGLEHRLEYVGQIKGVKYYNDSFSTTPDTAVAAIRSFSEPIILIIGGSEKNADYSSLGREINKSTVKTVIVIGETGQRIIKTFKHLNNKTINIIEKCKNMQEIVKKAKKEAKSGDVVLLSPASASFDMFRNYKDRGEQFKFAINNLKNSKL